MATTHSSPLGVSTSVSPFVFFVWFVVLFCFRDLAKLCLNCFLSIVYVGTHVCTCMLKLEVDFKSPSSGNGHLDLGVFIGFSAMLADSKPQRCSHSPDMGL